MDQKEKEMLCEISGRNGIIQNEVAGLRQTVEQYNKQFQKETEPIIKSMQQSSEIAALTGSIGIIVGAILGLQLLLGPGKTQYERIKTIEQKLNTVQSITVEKEVSVPTIPAPLRGNVIGGPLPDTYFVVGTDNDGNEQRAYLSI